VRINLFLNGLMHASAKPCFVGYDYKVERLYFPCNLLGLACKQSNAKKNMHNNHFIFVCCWFILQFLALLKDCF